MLSERVAVDISLLGSSFVIKYSDGSLQYAPMDKLVALSSKGPDFYFEVKHRQGSIERGQTVTAQITVVPTKKFDKEVKFSAVDVPVGIHITFDPVKTATVTTMTIRCGDDARLGQHILQISATDNSEEAIDGITREFDMIMFVTQPGSGLGINILPNSPVNGQAAVLKTDFTTRSGGVVPANTPMQFMSHTGWVASPSYAGNYGNWDSVRPNSNLGLSNAHHKYTVYTTLQQKLRPTPKTRRSK